MTFEHDQSIEQPADRQGSLSDDDDAAAFEDLRVRFREQIEATEADSFVTDWYLKTSQDGDTFRELFGDRDDDDDEGDDGDDGGNNDWEPRINPPKSGSDGIALPEPRSRFHHNLSELLVDREDIVRRPRTLVGTTAARATLELLSVSN